MIIKGDKMGLDIQGRCNALIIGGKAFMVSSVSGVIGAAVVPISTTLGAASLLIGRRGVVHLNTLSQRLLLRCGLILPDLFKTAIKLLNPQAKFPKGVRQAVVYLKLENLQGALTAKVFQLHLKAMEKTEKRNWLIRQTVSKVTEPLFLVGYVAARALDAVAGLFGLLVVILKRGQTCEPMQPEEAELIQSETEDRAARQNSTFNAIAEAEKRPSTPINWNNWTYRQLQITQLPADIHLCAMRFINADTFKRQDFNRVGCY